MYIYNQITPRLHSILHIFNQLSIKESVKNVAGGIALAFGVTELYHCCLLKKKKISNETDHASWKQIALKIALLFAKISILLSAAVSRPACFFLSRMVEIFVPSSFFDKIFGPNSTFQINPIHPRHVVSFLALALSLPLLCETISQSIFWSNQDNLISETPSKSASEQEMKRARYAVLTNAALSRPLLHCGNLFFKTFL